MLTFRETWENYPAISAWYDNVSKNEHVAVINKQFEAVVGPFLQMLA